MNLDDVGAKKLNILNIAPLASSSGLYGGPFDTSVAQSRLVNSSLHPRIKVTLFAPHFKGDKPILTSLSGNFVSPRIHRGFGRFRFIMSQSMSTTVALFREISRTDKAHISFGRELFPVQAAILCLFLGKPFILQTHGMLTSRTSFLHKVLDEFLKPIIRRASEIICLTPREARDIEALLNHIHPPIRVVGNPSISDLNQGHSHSFTLRRPEALFVARLHARKRVVDFVKASQIAANRNWTESYRIVGPDQGQLSLVKVATETAINLKYEGAISGPAVGPRVSESRVFVLCSLNEPWGNVLVQALSLGVPVVVTSSADLSSLVAAYGAGIVVPDQDPEAIAESVHKIVSCSADEYGIYCRQAIRLFQENMALDVIASELIAAYQK